MTLTSMTCIIHPSLSQSLQPENWDMLTGDGVRSISPKLCGGKFQTTGKKNKRGLCEKTEGDRVKTASQVSCLGVLERNAQREGRIPGRSDKITNIMTYSDQLWSLVALKQQFHWTSGNRC